MVIGLPSPPNATGAVSAIRSASAAALIGSKPIAMSMTAQMATGEPPPARASSSAPKNENAMTIGLDPPVVADRRGTPAAAPRSART